MNNDDRWRSFHMKKLMVSILMIMVVLSGCSVKKDNIDKVVENPKEDAEESHGPFIESEIKDIKILKDSVVLSADISMGPINTKYYFHAYQNGVPIEFSFDKDGDKRITQEITLTKEKNSYTFYMNARSFKKGDTVNFGYGVVVNPDYFPEIIEFTRFDIMKSNVSAICRDFNVDKDFIGNQSDKKILDNLEWTDMKVTDDKNIISSYALDTNEKILEQVVRNEPVNNLMVMLAKKGKLFKIFFVKDGLDANAIITFYIDHKPVMIKGDYVAGKLDYTNETFGMTSFELEIPQDVKEGNHTFYAMIFTNSNNRKHYENTEPRVLEVE